MADTVKDESVLEPVNTVRRVVDFSDDNDSQGYSDLEQLNEWKNTFKPIQEWWNDKVVPWFTKEKYTISLSNGRTSRREKLRL